MESSFTPIEQMLNFRANRQKDFPLQEIMLTRLCMHMQSKLLENRNKMLKAQGINETLFMALITLDAQEDHSIQPSELSSALGSSRTNATRIADELEKRGWIERRESDNDRRCLHLHLTPKGNEFLRQLLPPQHQCLQLLWSSLSGSEKTQLEAITRKLLNRLDQMDEEEVVASLSR
ncbi:transcriptional repressor MprA [bacteria symbiont BFo1 of Frankliniella occidentalis]|jgi:MarR family transcriptional repressor of emrRAB|uniref:Transcriptional repressor MprA n=1 Tax=Erwinia aphidicola TaxID=68334 RepID=A0ABU8DK71_ERWAP|nr:MULTISPECIES: transcriptional repressor MprA [Erwinia]KMV72055.1 transcriptional repressor MprA [bacteria symbiont BFo1 of Frankliniella occidentalis]PIJ59099.1 transcriptional repressor MprA [Erwinia sp. OLMDLW33]VTT29068.1 transcription repressor [Klebsiella pneumoniae]KYP85928.1 transcriptional repressor MprA [bacteria symbiont BFo1 of Frankliniella occidentalis]KYP91528.1 transcriptional repressor MprA [bacteria symbiont BFo1 of Frankliniella occidentalis]